MAPTYGTTVGGEPITDDMIERLAAEAEAGYEPGQLRGRPPIDATAMPDRIPPVRAGAELAAAVRRRAADDHVSQGEVVRRALAAYLRPAS